MASDRQLPEAERAAHQYADAGWHALALTPDSKVPFPGTHGFEDATTDHRQIERWWRAEPQSNVGIRTGAPFGPDVLDVDNHGDRSSGFAAFNQVKRAGLVEDPAALVRTPSGGFHNYFKGTEQPSGKLTRHALDFRAQGGYVVAPGSQIGGKPYVVVSHQPSAATVDFSAIRRELEPEAERPAWQPPEGKPGSLDHLPGWVASLPEGNRNDGLFWASVRAAEAGDRQTLAEIARAAEANGLSTREIAATVRSAQRTASNAASPKVPQRQLEAG